MPTKHGSAIAFPFDLGLDAIQHTVDEGAGLILVKLLAKLDRLVDRNAHGNLLAVKHFIYAKTKQGARNLGNTRGLPSLGMAVDTLVDLRKMLAHAKISGADVVVLLDLAVFGGKRKNFAKKCC